MNETVSHVEATFGGRPVRFELRRDRATVDRLEAQIGSVYAAWVRFRSEAWTLRDVRAVLALAHPRVAVQRQLGAHDQARLALAGRPSPGPELRDVPIERIDTVLQRRPLATYAPLAAAIVGAALFGRHADAYPFHEDLPGFPQTGAVAAA